MNLFKVSTWRNFHSAKLLESRNRKVFLLRPFRNFGIRISVSTSSLESALASALQKIYLKNRIFMFFLVLSYGVRTTLLQILISLRFPMNPFKGVHWCSRKRLFEHSEASVHWCFEKITAPKISGYFAYFPAKHPGWNYF